MHTPLHRQHEIGAIVGRGYEADAVYTVTNASSTTIHQKQERTEDDGSMEAKASVDLTEVQAREAESADPLYLQLDIKGLVANPYHVFCIP